MKRGFALFVLLGVAAIAMSASPAGGGNGPLCVLNTKMSAESEVPRGTSDAFGNAQVKLWSDGTVEWKVHIVNHDRETITAGHIHEAPAGVAGGVVVPLFGGPATDAKQFFDRGTSTIDPALAAAICGDPAEYYVNYHSDENPPGLARGQLG